MNQATSGPVHKEQTVGVLLGHLEKGWRAGHAEVASDFVSRWREKVAVSAEIAEIHDNALYFTADMGNIRLNGTDEAHCLVLSGADFSKSNSFAELWSKINGAGRLIFVVALSRESLQFALSQVPQDRAVVLAPDVVAAILESEVPLEELKRRIRGQLPIRRLIPFTIKNAVDGHMFSGRSRLLSRLRNEDDVSFALAGPGRIGKTSLLRRYHRLLVRERDPRMHCTFAIDCSNCQDRTPDGFARFVALKIESSHASANLTSDRLGNFFRFWRSHFNRPVALLLDEVDEIFDPFILRGVSLAAKDQLCRLIFAGKGVLLRSMLDRASPLACRIDLLRMEPLRQDEAAKLLTEPLHDLGFEIPEPQEVLSGIRELSGNFPHLVQYFGSRLADVLLTEESSTLCPHHVQQVRDSLEATSYFMSPFHDIADPKERIVALAMLTGNGERMHLSKIRGLVQGMGLMLEQQQVWDLCLALTICNILALDNGAFRVANHGLSYYISQTGFVDGALRDARAALAKAQEK